MFDIDPNHPDLKTMIPHIKMVEFKKGDMILRPYEETQYLHAIREGIIKIYTINNRGEEAISVIYGPDDLFPVAWIIGEKPQAAYLEALTDVRIALVPKDVFLEHIHSSAAISNAVMQKVIEMFALFSTRIANLEFKFARERLAYRLLLLAGKFGTRDGNSVVLPHFSQQDLGATINVAREGVSREMSRFERLGLVQYSQNNITILDVEKLHKEIGEDTPVFSLDKLA